MPCCPALTTVSAASWETLVMEWSPVRGADLYETRAVDANEVILCNDTAPRCALSDLTCNSKYSVVIIPCNDVSGCNLTCNPQTHETGISCTQCGTFIQPFTDILYTHSLLIFLSSGKLHACLRSPVWARLTRLVLVCWWAGLLITQLPTTLSVWWAQ